MAKGQMRSNKEAKKPKKVKATATPESTISSFAKGLSAPAGKSLRK